MAVVLGGCASTPAWTSDPDDQNNIIIENEIRKALKKPEGELTKSDLGKVTELNFLYRGLTDLSALAGLTKLKGLNLTRNPIPNGQLKYLADLPQLTQLDLNYTEITDLSALAGFKKLEVLDLQRTLVADISPLAKLTQLKEINLSYMVNVRGDDVSALTGLKQLESVTIMWNGFRNDQLKHLAGLTQLRYLNLHGNVLSDVSVLAKLTKLEYLNLGTGLGGARSLRKSEIDKLQKALPKCEIVATPSLR